MRGSRFKPALSKKSRYKNGEIPASKLKKFIQTELSKTFVYRSSYEYSFMIWCEQSPKVKGWSSEPFSIKYFCPVKKKERSYWIDFTMIMFDNQKVLVEVKPEKDLKSVKLFQVAYSRLTTSEAKTSFIQGNKTSANNFAKWQAAKAFSKANNMIFQVVTEKFLTSYL